MEDELGSLMESISALTKQGDALTTIVKVTPKIITQHLSMLMALKPDGSLSEIPSEMMSRIKEKVRGTGKKHDLKVTLAIQLLQLEQAMSIEMIDMLSVDSSKDERHERAKAATEKFVGEMEAIIDAAVKGLS